MNLHFEKYVLSIFSNPRFKFQTYWFKNFLYIFLIAKTAYWLIHYELYFGADPIIFSNHFSVRAIKDLAFLLYGNSSPLLGYFFIIPLFLLCCLGLKFKRPYFIPDFLIWFLTVNLSNKVYPTLTGGDYLLNQFLFFNCFLSTSWHKKPGKFSELKICLHNFSIAAIISQVCLVYLISALAKANDAAWVSGSAISDLSLINHFNMFRSLNPQQEPLLFAVFINYLILFYQLSFPVLVWFKKIKKPFILIGLLMHLYIAFVMGLVEFGFIMILGYIYFWPFKKPVS